MKTLALLIASGCISSAMAAEPHAPAAACTAAQLIQKEIDAAMEARIFSWLLLAQFDPYSFYTIYPVVLQRSMAYLLAQVHQECGI